VSVEINQMSTQLVSAGKCQTILKKCTKIEIEMKTCPAFAAINYHLFRFALSLTKHNFDRVLLIIPIDIFSLSTQPSEFLMPFNPHTEQNVKELSPSLFFKPPTSRLANFCRLVGQVSMGICIVSTTSSWVFDSLWQLATGT